MSETLRQILHMVRDGAITAEEAGRLLKAIDGGATGANAVTAAAPAPAAVVPADGEVSAPPASLVLAKPAVGGDAGSAGGMGNEAQNPDTYKTTPSPAPATVDLASLRRLWRLAFGVGAAIMAAAAVGMATSYRAQGGLTAAFLILWGIFIGAALVAAASLWARTASWMHLRIRAAEADIRLAAPFPLGFVAWGVRAARPFVRRWISDADLDALIGSLERDALADKPLYVEAYSNDGKFVLVYIE